jgi:hypothetical protein
VTAGFAMTCMHFSTALQKAARYRYLGRDAQAPYAHVVAFAQNPDALEYTTLFNMKGASVTLRHQGIAWIDPETFQIVRLRTDLLEPFFELGLMQTTTEISYNEVQFTSSATPLWLPREVLVTIRWNGKNFSNRHRYSDYRLFTVETREKTERLAPRPEKTP